MQLLSTLSHMPFLAGDDLYFCGSDGVQAFSPRQTVFDITNKIPPRVMHFQSWEIMVKKGEAITKLTHKFRLGGPFRIFCNPVVTGESISFLFSRSLYTGRIEGSSIVDSKTLFQGVFTGFSSGAKTVLGKMPCAEGSQVIVIDSTGRSAFNTAFTEVLRVIPSGDDLILTGKLGRDFASVLLVEDVARRIQVRGQDVYKCCLTPDRLTVIHAVKTNGFEERYLHSDTAELVEMPDFIRE